MFYTSSDRISNLMFHKSFERRLSLLKIRFELKIQLYNIDIFDSQFNHEFLYFLPYCIWHCPPYSLCLQRNILLTTEKKNFFNSMKIEGEVNFSDLRLKSEKKSYRNKKVHNSVKT